MSRRRDKRQRATVPMKSAAEQANERYLDLFADGLTHDEIMDELTAAEARALRDAWAQSE